MKVIVTMAGRGSRLKAAGYRFPKPLVSVAGRPMIQQALRSLESVSPSEIIFVILKEHDRRFDIGRVVCDLGGPTARIVLQEDFLPGQLCSALEARDFISGEEDILIAPADTHVVSNLGRDIKLREPTCAGLISVAAMAGDRWSFARANSAGRVLQVTEKVRMTPAPGETVWASTGLYYFSRGREFVEIASEIVRRGDKTHGEFYVMPVYQEYLERGRHVGLSVATEMWDMGTPEALKVFTAHCLGQGPS